MCRTEREKYAKHKRKAEKQPARYMSLIIDGMDQEKTNIPHIISNPKVSELDYIDSQFMATSFISFFQAISGAYRLETHVTGIRAHGRKTVMAIDCNDFKHDSNLTIEIILRMLMLLKVIGVPINSISFVIVMTLTGFSAPDIVCPNGQHVPR